jgi:small-conductance mechanosensitive channel
MPQKTVAIPESVARRTASCLVFGALAYASHWLDRQGLVAIQLSADHSLLEFASLACAVLAALQLASLGVVYMVQRRQGPEGEVRMLNGFLRVLAILIIIGSLVYSLGRLQAVGTLAAGFAGMLLGWSLQAPVSGVAAWVLVTLKRPFRIGDRVFFSSLGTSALSPAASLAGRRCRWWFRRSPQSVVPWSEPPWGRSVGRPGSQSVHCPCPEPGRWRRMEP